LNGSYFQGGIDEIAREREKGNERVRDSENGKEWERVF